MKNSMKVGDQVLFYHSNTKAPGIVGKDNTSTVAFSSPLFERKKA